MENRKSKNKSNKKNSRSLSLVLTQQGYWIWAQGMGGDREQVIQLMEVTQAATGWFGSDLEQLRWRRCSCSLECAASVAVLLLPSLILSL